MMTDTKDDTFNKIHKGDPKEDFLINYRNATIAILNKGKEKKPNIHGKPSQVAAGVTIPGSASKVVTFDRSKLDPVERGMAEGFSDAELVKMFERV